MNGTFPVSAELSMEVLASTLTTQEQLDRVRVTALIQDSAQPRNLVTFVAEEQVLGDLRICQAGEPCEGKKLLSSTVYIANVSTKIDLYRLDDDQS